MLFDYSPLFFLHISNHPTLFLHLLISFISYSGYGGKDKGGESAIADQWFESQKKFYVDMGKTLGDTVNKFAIYLYGRYADITA